MVQGVLCMLEVTFLLTMCDIHKRIVLILSKALANFGRHTKHVACRITDNRCPPGPFVFSPVLLLPAALALSPSLP